jgi:hypothetical protein
VSDVPLIANALAISLRPIVRQTAHQLTLMGLVQDSDEFARNWLGAFDAYKRLPSSTLLELADVVQSLEFGLGLQECLYQSDFEDAVADRDRWQARVRLSALRLQLIRLRRWKRESGWQTVMFD